jgi:dephospho-CoA kinase
MKKWTDQTMKAVDKKGPCMNIFIVVGMPASGKNIAKMYADARGIPYFATGDVVRSEVKKRGLAPDAANTAAVSTELRGNDGLGVTRHALAAALETGQEMVFMEGMRSWQEIELIREKTPCTVIAFLAPRWMRLERITSRQRSDDSPHSFAERDMREIAYGTAVPVALGDEYVLNTSSIEDALRELDIIVQRHLRPIS